MTIVPVTTKELSNKKKVKVLHILIATQSDVLQFKYPNLTTLASGFIEIVTIIAGTDGLEYLAARIQRAQRNIADTT